MLTILFIILLLGTMFRLIGMALRMSWGILMVLLAIVFFPLVLLLMVFVGGEHSANAILKSQSAAISDMKKFDTQRHMVKLAYNLKDSLENNNIDDFGRILHENWLLKKSLTSGISTGIVDEMYNKGIEAGALGGKLLGAGGAGFILFYCPKERQQEFRERMGDITELNFKFDNYGSKIIYVGEKVNIWR